jgi:hypothetical protein
MYNNEMNLPLFILIKYPYFTSRVDLSFFPLTLFYFFCSLYKCSNGPTWYSCHLFISSAF